MTKALPSEELRTPETAGFSDVRSPMFGIKNLNQQYESISVYKLKKFVPEDIRIQFDVARNLYLYAYNVYRFYMVAEHHLYTTLEFAIRERVGKEKLRKYAKKNKMNLGLRAYMKYLYDYKLLRNEDFPTWNHKRRMDAKSRQMRGALKEVRQKGLTSTDIEEEVDVNQYEFDYDYFQILCGTIPAMRNEHAHGSKTLFCGDLHTFENVSIIINAIYSEGDR